MIRLNKGDYANLFVFVLVVSLVITSYINSDFYDPTLFSKKSAKALVGHTIHKLDNIQYSYGYESDDHEQAFVGDEIIFYITILRSLTYEPVDSATCTLTIGNGASEPMQYSGSSGWYVKSETFTSADTYDYDITCDVSSIGEGLITVEDTATILNAYPDFTVALEADDFVDIDDNAEITVTVSNTGPAEFIGSVVLNLDFGDYEVATSTVVFDSSEEEVMFTHNYTSTATYHVVAIVDATESITEVNEGNNDATTDVTVIDSSGQASAVCGNLTQSVILASNLYCEDGITITSSDITLDCNNHRIYGDGISDGETGINVTTSGCKIKNCRIDKYRTGVSAKYDILLENNSISDTEIALVLLNDDNEIMHNIFDDNAVAIWNKDENVVNYNDFYDNALVLNTTAETDFRWNYFETSNIELILSDMINTSAVLIEPVLDESARTANLNNTGPNLTLEINQSDDDFETLIQIKVDTDKEAKCRYSENSSDYYDMYSLETSDGYTHTKELEYVEPKKFKLYFMCRDVNGGYSLLFSTEDIEVKHYIDVRLDELKELLEDYQDALEDFKDDREDYQDYYDDETDDAEKERLKEKMDSVDIDIAYYEMIIENLKDYKKYLEDVQSKRDDIEDDYLDEYEEDIEDILGNLTSVEDDIEGAIDDDSDEIYDLMSDKYDLLTDLYRNYEWNQTRYEEREDLLRNYIVERAEWEKKDIMAEKEKYQALDNLEKDLDYTDYIEDLTLRIIDKEDEIAELEYEEKLEDLESELDMLRLKADMQHDYLSEVNDMLDIIEDRISYAANNNDNDLKADLEKLKIELENLQDDIKAVIEALEEDIEVKDEEITIYKKTRTAAGVSSSEMYSVELIIKWDPNSAENRISADIDVDDVLIDNIVAEFEGTPNKDSYIGIYIYEEAPYNDTGDIKIDQWMFINNSNNITIRTLEIYFNISDSYLSKNSISPTNISAFYHTSRFERINTELLTIPMAEESPSENSEEENDEESSGDSLDGELLDDDLDDDFLDDDLLDEDFLEDDLLEDEDSDERGASESDADEYRYRAVLTRPGNAGIGYSYALDANAGAHVPLICAPKWECGDFSECNEINKRSQDCIDVNNCDPDNNKKIVEEECPEIPDATGEPSCDDGIQNGEEEGVDCGGICPNECPQKEEPTIVEESAEEEKGGEILKIVLIIVAVAGIMVGAVFGVKKIKSSQHALQEERPRELFNHNAVKYVVSKIVLDEDANKIVQDLMKLGSSAQEAQYYTNIVQYIFGRLEKNPNTQIVINELTTQRWEPNLAKELVRFIAVNNLRHQIKDFGSMSGSESDNNIVKEMLRMEGHDEDIIGEALKPEEQNQNEGIRNRINSTQFWHRNNQKR